MYRKDKSAKDKRISLKLQMKSKKIKTVFTSIRSVSEGKKGIKYRKEVSMKRKKERYRK